MDLQSWFWELWSFVAAVAVVGWRYRKLIFLFIQSVLREQQSLSQLPPEEVEQLQQKVKDHEKAV